MRTWSSIKDWSLPYFAAFDLLKTPQGEFAVCDYYRSYTEFSKKFGVGLILESTTWRASRDWGAWMDYSFDTLAEANRKAVASPKPIGPRW